MFDKFIGLSKIRHKILFLLILPFTLITIEFFLRQSRGPFWLLTNTDPCYAYLIYILDLIKHGKTMGYQHPGITLQLLGVVVVKIIYFFRHSSADIEIDVLKNPEVYLEAINFTIICLAGIALFIAGNVLYNYTRNIGISILIQFIPFISMRNIMVLTYVCPEPILIISILIYAVLIVIIAHNNKGRKNNLYIYILAIISGFALATKLLFLPYLVIPLFIIKDVRTVIIYFLLIAFCFFIWTIPIIPLYKTLFIWLKNILTHKKPYGMGEYELFNLNKYINNIICIFKTNFVFTFIFFMSIIFVLLNKFSRRLSEISQGRQTLKLLVGIVFSQVIAVLLIAKHYSGNHYLIANYCFSGLALTLMVLYLYQINHLFRVNINGIIRKTLIFIFLVMIIRFGYIIKVDNEFNKIKSETEFIHHKVLTEYTNYAKIYYNRCSSEEFALLFANTYSRFIFTNTLRKLYGEINYYDKIGRKFYTWDRPISLDSLKIKYSNKIVFQGKPLKGEEMPEGIQLDTIVKGKWEMIYQVR